MSSPNPLDVISALPDSVLGAMPPAVLSASLALMRLAWDASQANGDRQRVEDALMTASEGLKAALDAHRFGA
jgi:hypothetical protein